METPTRSWLTKKPTWGQHKVTMATDSTFVRCILKLHGDSFENLLIHVYNESVCPNTVEHKKQHIKKKV